MELYFYPKIYDLYKERERKRSYDLFASDPYDDAVITELADGLNELGREYGLDKTEITYLTISFVQSLPYTSDSVTAGFDEYPRFPYETLYDDGGDCEDTSILSAALLQEMGYGVVLILFPREHVGIGIKCSSNVGGYRYKFENQDYCYLETTGKNWDIGMLPEIYRGKKAQIIPIYKRPYLDIDFNYKYRYNVYDVYTDVNITITNLGSDTAEGVKIYTALQTSDTTKVWSQIESDTIDLEPEEAYSYQVSNLHSPTGKNFRPYVRAYGDNIISDPLYGQWISWKS